jgi:hypothetical protein
VCRRLGGTKGALSEQGNIFFSKEKEMKIINWKQVFFFVHHRIVSAVKSVEFETDRMCCIVLRDP